MLPEIFRNPFLLDGIIKIAEKLIDKFSGTSGNVGHMERIDENSSASDIENMIDSLDEYRKNLQSEISEIGEMVSKEVQYYVQEVQMFLEDKKELLEKYKINEKRLNKEISKLLLGVKEYMDNEINRKVSLGNPELKNILKMIPGAPKEEAMKNLSSEIIHNALEGYCTYIRGVLAELSDLVEENTIRLIEDIADEVNRNREQLEAITKEDDVEKSEQMIGKAEYIIYSCCKVQGMLGE